MKTTILIALMLVTAGAGLIFLGYPPQETQPIQLLASPVPQDFVTRAALAAALESPHREWRLPGTRLPLYADVPASDRWN